MNAKLSTRLWKWELPQIVLSAVLVFAVTLTAGCGSDNNPTNANGSLSDPAFVDIQPQVNTFLDSVFVAFSAGLGSYNEVPITDGQIKKFYGPGIPGGTNQSTYEYTVDGWHHITLIVNNTSVVIGVNDSIQFKNGMTPQQASDSADALDYRHHWSVTQADQTADFTNFSGDVGYIFSNLNTQNALINGSYGYNVAQRKIDSAAVVTDDSFTFASAATNVSVSQPSGGIWGTGCPSGGSMSFSVEQVKIVTNGSTVDTTNISWTGTASFTNGAATVSVTDGTTSWAYIVSVCSPAL